MNKHSCHNHLQAELAKIQAKYRPFSSQFTGLLQAKLSQVFEKYRLLSKIIWFHNILEIGVSLTTATSYNSTWARPNRSFALLKIFSIDRALPSIILPLLETTNNIHRCSNTSLQFTAFSFNLQAFYGPKFAKRP